MFTEWIYQKGKTNKDELSETLCLIIASSHCPFKFKTLLEKAKKVKKNSTKKFCLSCILLT